MTLQDARNFQRKKERRTLLSFVIGLVFIFVLFLFFLLYTDQFQRHTSFPLLIPLFIGILIYRFPVYLFLTPKESRWIVVKCDFWVRIRDLRTKSMHRYMVNDFYTKINEIPMADLSLQNEQGKEKKISFRCRERLPLPEVGDTVLLLRFVKEPILIKSQTDERPLKSKTDF